jgi:hypothetical protein
MKDMKPAGVPTSARATSQHHVGDSHHIASLAGIPDHELEGISNIEKGFEMIGGSLNLENCIKIESLPENLEVKEEINIKNSGLEKYSKEELDEMYPKLKGKWIF